jgi:hypothetical protein
LQCQAEGLEILDELLDAVGNAPLLEHSIGLVDDRQDAVVRMKVDHCVSLHRLLLSPQIITPRRVQAC